jgi:hypothetical protein
MECEEPGGVDRKRVGIRAAPCDGPGILWVVGLYRGSWSVWGDDEPLSGANEGDLIRKLSLCSLRINRLTGVAICCILGFCRSFATLNSSNVICA